jgi:superfamily II DNA/RNA helicase
MSKAGNKRMRDQSSPASDCRRVAATLSGNTNKPTRNYLSPSISTSQTKQLRASEIENVSSECSKPKNGSSVSSQKRAIASTPTLGHNAILSLAYPAYDLPEKLIQNLSALGINSICPWQSRCLLESKLLHDEGNLVYTAPTGGGKSLVAEVLMLK